MAPQSVIRSSSPGGKPVGLISRWTASLLRIILVPLLLIGLPAWPILAITCAIPFLALVTIPIFIGLTVLLLYASSWYAYLLLAQTDDPRGHSRRLPFLPYSPTRCIKVTYAALQYAATAVQLTLPAALDWSYRRVMVLGTAAGNAVVKEGIVYDEAANKRLDVYLPPSSHRGQQQGSRRTRKHSTQFAEDIPSVDGNDDLDASAAEGSRTPNRPRRGAAVIVFLPSCIPPATWSSKRKAYLQLALRLRRMGNCIVVPDISYFPDSRIKESIHDVRLVLRWVGDNISGYGGDANRIHLFGHGLSAHLALLTLTQEAAVLSREGVLEAQADRERRKATIEQKWQEEEENRRRYTAGAGTNGSGDSPATLSPPKTKKVPGRPALHASPSNRSNNGAGDSWVDELPLPDNQRSSTTALPNGLGPGIVMSSSGSAGTPFPPSAGAPAGPASPHSTAGTPSNPPTPVAIPSRQRRFQQLQASGSNTDLSSDDQENPRRNTDLLLDIPIPNGLRRVQIYSPQISIPPISGLILFSVISDVIKSFRGETEKGLEDLSVLRRWAGPSHTNCLLHSPAHLLYASKNLLDPTLLPPKVLLVHGGNDSVVPIEQSTLLKTLLVGIGVSHVKLRAYRKLGHVESLACLFLGMGKGWKRYQKMIVQDLEDFLAV